jgi:hypothetical protein
MSLFFRSAFPAFALVCLSSPAQTLSASKLSAHLINAYTGGSSNIVDGSPRTLKVLGLDSGFPSGMLQAMRDYKARVPSGKLVVRVYSPKTYSLTNDATASAGDYWTNVLQQSLNTISPSDRALIDYLEGPNEGDTPTLGNPSSAPLQASQWFNQFWTNLTPRIAAAGYKPCIGSIAVGNPGGSTSEMQSYLAAFVPALRQAKAAGGAWSYHAYTINYSTDPNVEIYYSLRYRQFYSYFASSFPDLSSMTMILTEGGVDESGDRFTSGWQARGSRADYERWLNWFDHQIQQDSYLLGCTLFENGDSTGWPSFELEPIGGWFKTYLLAPPTVPSPPTGLIAVAGNAAVTLSWTNAPLNPTIWSVKRSTNNGGPYFTIATNITTGVTATSYTDSSVSNFTTYYYVITAVNSVGESHNSSQVTATPAGVVPMAINSGGSAVGSFLADVYYSAGTAFSTGTAITTNGVAAPAPMPVYQSQRYGDLTYTLPYLTPKASYKVRLHFAEVYWNASGQRIFNVFINGAQVLSNFDIFAAAGTSFKAVIQEFNAISDSSGTISVQIVTVLDNPAINGIELVANPTNSIPAAPANLAAGVANALVTLSWSPPVGATSFSVKRSATNGGPYSIIASNLISPAYRDPSFAPNTTYYYVVSALNSLGESPNSAQVSALPASGLPDVVITSVTWTPTNLFTGSNVVFKATVLNRGSASTPSATTVGVGFNVDGAGTVSWSSGYSTALAPNESITLAADGGPGVVNYWTATLGPHTVTATVDDINRFPESIEDNNSTSAAFTVLTARYALNSGGGAVGAFSADAKYAGSANTFSVTNAIDLAGLTNAAPVGVYQSERWGDFAYVLDNFSPGSNYTVRLHFAEISPSVSNIGDRRFNISLNGLQVFSDFDVLAAAGAKFRAVTREIKKRADSAGTLTIQFSRGSSNEPKCSGIEVFPSAVSPAPQITALAVTNGTAILTWQSSPATLYQAQYKDDLKAANWATFGNTLLGSGGPLSATNSVPGIAQRFYRIAQL